MKKTIGICFFVIFLLLSAAGMVFLYRSDAGDAPEPEKVALEMESETEEPVELTESMSVQDPYQYMIREYNGVLVVYQSDGQTILFETDIWLDELDENLQEKVLEGIGFATEKELYDFLESYSS